MRIHEGAVPGGIDLEVLAARDLHACRWSGTAPSEKQELLDLTTELHPRHVSQPARSVKAVAAAAPPPPPPC